MEGISISSLTQLASGTILAATHGVGVARSTDDGQTWAWSIKELVQYDLWAETTVRDEVLVLSAGDVWRIEPGILHGKTWPLNDAGAVLIDIFNPAARITSLWQKHPSYNNRFEHLPMSDEAF